MTPRLSLVLLPGLLCDAEMWRAQAESLADVADVHTADLTRDCSIAGMAQRVLAAAPKRFALAGHSMGGIVALEIVHRAPARVSRLALLGTPAGPDPPAQAARRRQFIRMAREGRSQGTRLLSLYMDATLGADDPLAGPIKAMADRVGPRAFLRQQKAVMGRPDGRPRLAAISCPALVLCGRQDRLTPLAEHETMAASIPTASLVVVEDCGHLSTMAQPEAVSAAMGDWLRGG